MKTLSQNQNKAERKINKLFLTTAIVAFISSTLFIGSMNTNAFSQPSTKMDNGLIHIGNDILLPAITINKEVLPTIFLSEITITSTKSENL